MIVKLKEEIDDCLKDSTLLIDDSLQRIMKSYELLDESEQLLNSLSVYRLN